MGEGSSKLFFLAGATLNAEETSDLRWYVVAGDLPSRVGYTAARGPVSYGTPPFAYQQRARSIRGRLGVCGWSACALRWGCCGGRFLTTVAALQIVTLKNGIGRRVGFGALRRCVDLL
jgi:hypothetical protein